MGEHWESIALRKREQLASRIPKEWRLKQPIDADRLNVTAVPRECGILTPEELRLTEQFDATALLSGLSTGILKSVDVVTAFCKRAAIAQQCTNCLTEILFPDAIARAQELDAYFTRTRKPIGPLHGLPISLKDTFKIRGYDSSIGVAALCFKPATANSALVDLLLELGAVLYVKTNVPQTMAALDSHNNVFGRTLNPANRLLTAGGSSGGEGALVGMRGSVLGIGTDIGGSIRVPALCNGLYGVKPSHGRVPYAGQEGGMKEGSSKLGIEATAGPIAGNMRDCELFLGVVSDAMPTGRDPEVIAQIWKQQASLRDGGMGRKLRVGIMRTDGHVTPLPPVQRMLDEVAQALSTSSAGVEVVELDLTSFGPQCLKTFNGIMSIDGANTWFDILESHGEPLSPWLSMRLKRRPGKSVDQIRELQAQRTNLHTRFLDVWKESGGYWRSSTPSPSEKSSNRRLDLIICPGAPHPVAAIDRWNDTNYTSMFNLLDLPCGILPVRPFVDQDMQGEVEATKPLNGWDKVNREMWTGFDRKLYKGSMLTVQVVAPRLEERRLVEGMGILDDVLRSTRDAGAGKSKL